MANKYPGKLMPKNMTVDELKSEDARSHSKPKTQRRESDSVVKPELTGRIENSQASARDWKPK